MRRSGGFFKLAVVSAVLALGVSGCSRSVDLGDSDAADGSKEASSTSSSDAGTSVSPSSSKKKPQPTLAEVEEGAGQQGESPEPPVRSSVQPQEKRCAPERISREVGNEEPGRFHVLHCDGFLAVGGIWGTDGVITAHYESGSWQIIPKDGKTRTGFPCFTEETAKANNIPEFLYDKVTIGGKPTESGW